VNLGSGEVFTRLIDELEPGLNRMAIESQVTSFLQQVYMHISGLKFTFHHFASPLGKSNKLHQVAEETVVINFFYPGTARKG
jgi:hypothetical protein